MMEFEQILLSLRRSLSTERFTHSMQVMQLMAMAAPRYGLDPVRAATAGLLHDMAWHLPIAQMVVVVRRNEPYFLAKLPKEKQDHAHLHGPAGAWLSLEQFEVRDPLVFSAIHDHAGTSSPMPLITRCLYAADCLLPSANQPQRDEKGIGLLLNGDLTVVEARLRRSPTKRASCLIPRVRPSDPSSLL